jgi:solute carrier family 45, member 1/2/4
MGYVAGAVDLVETFGTTLGDTQFKQLTILAVIAMVSTNAITCWAVSEKVHSAHPSSKNDGRFQVVRQIYSTVRHLPPRIQAICWAQFWSWIGWFPFLFYSTTWIGETYYRYDAPPDAKSSGDALGDIGRIGSTSLVIYSSITFAGAFVLPLLIKSPEDKGFTPRPPPALAGFLKRAHEMKPDLLTAWMVGHLMFSASMLLAPFATSFRFATVLVSICGMYAPSIPRSLLALFLRLFYHRSLLTRARRPVQTMDPCRLGPRCVPRHRG